MTEKTTTTPLATNEDAVRIVGLVAHALRSAKLAQTEIEGALEDVDGKPDQGRRLCKARRLLRLADRQLEMIGIEVADD